MVLLRGALRYIHLAMPISNKNAFTDIKNRGRNSFGAQTYKALGIRSFISLEWFYAVESTVKNRSPLTHRLSDFVIHLATAPEERTLIKKHSYSDLKELAIFECFYFFERRRVEEN